MSDVAPRLLRAVGVVAALTTAAFVLAPAGSARAATGPRTFYVAPTGHDSADGLSPGTAWQSLAQVNRTQLQPGDAVLLQAGQVFPGGLVLDSSDAGSAAAPVRVSSFGVGPAIIAPTDGAGVQVYDTAGVEISQLKLLGTSSTAGRFGGISAYSDLPAGTRLSGLSIHDVEVGSFRNGIEIGGANPGAGFDHVVVRAAKVHDNREAGLISYGPAFSASAPTYANTDVTVSGVDAYSNLGDPSNTTRNTGNGIVLGSVLSGSITGSRAWANGALCRAPEGPAGIWTYDSRSVRIAYNASHGNRSGSTVDGDGFDLDQNVSSSLLEHNNSWSNDGAGYLVYTGQSNDAQRDNVIRSNASTADAQKNSWYGGVTVAGRVLRAQVYGNVLNSGLSAAHAPAISVQPGSVGLVVSKNAFHAGNGAAAVAAPAAARSAVSFSSNFWPSLAVPVRWGSHLPTVAVWKAVTGES